MASTDQLDSLGPQSDKIRMALATSMAWFVHGYECKRRGDLEAAREAFEHAVSGVYGPLAPSTRAGAFRVLGELAEARSDLAGAMDCYRNALAEDPKIGVSKRLAALAHRPSRVVKKRL